MAPLGFWGKAGHQQKTQDDNQISLDDQKWCFSGNGKSTLPLVPARRTAAIAQGCVSRGAGTAVDAS